MLRRLALILILTTGLAGTALSAQGTQPPPAPPGPFLTTGEIPDFRFKVRIGGDTPGARESGCIEETLCVSGALPGRSEMFLRVIGPRPNGFLWVNVVRFTPSELEVWAERRSTGVTRYYRLPALPRTSDRLRGMVDKRAFRAGAGASAVAGVRRGRLEPVPAAAPEAVRFVPPAFPDYEFTVRIVAGGESIPARRESRCLPETVCVSGALPGRSELFLRIIGPRPNDFFHVNLVRFTTSRVEVEIRRLSTGERRSYTLAAIPRASDALDGRLDRNAFRVAGEDLPPDPGPANDATLDGIDADGDGVRDDVQRFIALQYGEDPDMVAALRQGARALLEGLAASDRGQPVIDDAAATNRALECLTAVDPEGSREAFVSVAAEVIDTERRFREYLDYQETLGPQLFRVPDPDQWAAGCDFQPTGSELRRRYLEALEDRAGACGTVSDGTLFFINGVWNDSWQAHHNATLLLYHLEGISLEPGVRLDVYALFNPHQGYVADLWEAVQQRQQLAVSRFLRMIAGIEVMPDFMQSLFFSLSRAADEAALVSSPILQGHLDAYREELAEGKKVLAVPHSQGNFFANQAWRHLTGEERRSLGIVSVANPDSRVEDGRGRYTNHVSDLVVAAVPGSLAGNVGGPAGDLLGHGFGTTYLRPRSPARRRIVRHVETAFSSLEPPDPIAEDGVITVTLTWGAEPDVDLHVTEPNGTHVYWGNQRGPSGTLDVDDRNGFGPEHYVVSCDTLEAGVYPIGVNYYAGRGSETARVKVDAGFVARRFSVFLDRPRGPSGVDSPLPVARIVVTGTDRDGYEFRVVPD